MIPTISDINLAKQIYTNYFGRIPSSIHFFTNGLSNVVIKLDETIVRIKKSNDFNFYSWNNEIYALKETSKNDISPEILSIDNNNLAILYKYVDGKNFINKRITNSNLYNAGDFLQKLHSLCATNLTDFSAKNRFNIYKEKSNIIDTSNGEEIIRKIVESDIENNSQCFSHNDIVCGNLLYNESNKKISLIDYDYVGKNNEMFDLASLLSENNIEDIKQKESLLLGYYKNLTNDLIDKCNLYILYEDYLWFYWAMANYIESNNKTFLLIAKDKQKNISIHNKFIKQLF